MTEHLSDLLSEGETKRHGLNLFNKDGTEARKERLRTVGNAADG